MGGREVGQWQRTHPRRKIKVVKRDRISYYGGTERRLGCPKNHERNRGHHRDKLRVKRGGHLKGPNRRVLPPDTNRSPLKWNNNVILKQEQESRRQKQSL